MVVLKMNKILIKQTYQHLASQSHHFLLQPLYSPLKLLVLPYQCCPFLRAKITCKYKYAKRYIKSNYMQYTARVKFV